MSWSFSLRSPSLTPPPLSTSPSTTDATSLWDNEGDRNDPIDIGSVWEPQIDFKETPFTIAKRNGGNQAGASSRLGFKLENLQQQKKKTPRTPSNIRPTPVDSTSYTPSSENLSKKMKSSVVSTLSNPATISRKKGVNPSAPVERSSKPLKGYLFEEKTIQGHLDKPAAKRPLPNPSLAQASTESSLKPAQIQQKTPRVVSSFESKLEEKQGLEVELDAAIPESKPKRALLLQRDTQENVPTSDPPSSSPFQFYADSEELRNTNEASPSPFTSPSADSPLQSSDTRPTPSLSKLGCESSNPSSSNISSGPSNALPRQVEIVRPNPVRSQSTNSLASPSLRPFKPSQILPSRTRALQDFRSPPRQDSRLPSPFLSASPAPTSGSFARLYVHHLESEPTDRRGVSQTIRSKPEKFRNPKSQMTNSFEELSAIPRNVIDHSKYDRLSPPRLPNRSDIFYSSPSSSRIDNSPLPPPPLFSSATHPHTAPLSTPRSTYNSSSSKFSLPIVGGVLPPSVSKKRRMNFLPLEPIEQFQKRKGIFSGTAGPDATEEIQGEEGMLDSPTRNAVSLLKAKTKKRNRTDEEEEDERSEQVEGGLIWESSSSSSSSSHGKVFGGGGGEPKVVLGTTLRSFKPQSSSSSSSALSNGGRGGSHGRRRGGSRRISMRGGGNGYGVSRIGGLRIDEVNEDEEEEESREEKLRRLYRSLD